MRTKTPSQLKIIKKSTFIVICLLVFSMWPTNAIHAQTSLQADLNMSFTPTSISSGGVSRLSITIYNPNAFPLTLSSLPDPAWTNTLDARLSFANPANITTDCGGTVTTIGKTLTLIGGTVPAKDSQSNGHCTVSVDVTSTTAGNIPNNIPANTLKATNADGSIQVTNPTPASIDLLVNAVQPPSLSTAFAPNTIWVARTSILTINIRNNDANTALQQVSLTNNLPAQVKVASPVTTSTTCGGTVEAIVDSSTVRLTNGTVPIDGSCTVSVTVTSTTAGVYTNLIPANSIQSRQGVTNASAASAPLNVQSVGLSKRFSPANFQSGNSSTLIITLQNPTGAEYHNASLSDTLPAGLIVASPPAANQCGGAVTSTANSVSLTGGVIPAGNPGSCEVRVIVTSTTPASYTNIIPVGALTTSEGASNVIAATANISVYANGLGLSASKGFSQSPIPVNGRSQMYISLTAPGDSDLHSFSITDSLPSGLRVDNNPGISYTGCGSPSFAPAPGDTLLHFSNGTILAGTTCTIRVYITAAAPGVYTNTISPANITNAENRNIGGNISGSLTVSGLSIRKLFMPTSVNPEGVSTLSIILENDNPSQLDNVSFTDILPATDANNGLFVAPTPNLKTTCGSPDILSVSTNGSGIQTISMTGGTIPARVGSVAGICTVSVDVVGKGVNHTYTNRISSGNVSGTIHGTSTVIVNPAQASADLEILSIHIDVVQSFSPEIVSSGSPSTLTINLTNPNSAPLTGIRFTNNFPVPDPLNNPGRGMKVATPANPSVGTCGGSITAVPGSTSFTYSGGYLAANATCALTLQVTMNVNSNLINTIHAGDITTTNGAANLQDVSATLTNQPAASVSKIFGPNPINAGPGNESTLTITLQNYSNFPITGVGLIDHLPADMTVIEPPTTTCSLGTGGSVSESGGVVTLTGAQLDDLSNCTIEVKVTAPAAGSYQNCIPSSSLTNAQNATNATAACDTLDVLAIPDAPAISKAFSPGAIQANDISDLTFTLTNPNDVPLNGLSFTDTFPSNLSLASIPNTVQCGGEVSATPGSITLTGGTLASHASCTVIASVTASVGGEYTNTSGPIGWTYNGTSYSGSTASDGLTVVEPPVISKTFSPDAITAGGISTLTFTITNPIENTVPLNGVTFTDIFPTGLTVSAPPAAEQCDGGTVSSTNQSITLADGAIPVGGSCTVSVNVTGGGGVYENISNPVTSTNAGTGNSAADTLTISGGGLLLEKATSTAGFHAVGDSIVYQYKLTNTGTIPLYGAGPGGVFMVTDDKIGAFACDETTTSLAAGASLVCDSQTYSVIQGDVDARLVTNTAGASASDQQTGGNTVTSNQDSVTVRLEALRIKKQTSTTGYRSVGNSIVYSFTITNTGDVPLYGTGAGGVFMVQDDLIGSFACHSTITSLAPGENLPCTGTKTYIVTADDLTAGSVINRATAAARDKVSGGNTITSNEDSVEVYEVTPPTISKQFNETTIPVGGIAALTFTLTNPVTNSIPLVGVSFTDHLPAGITVANSPEAAQCGGTVTTTEDTITLSGGTIIADSEDNNNHCTIAVSVTAGAPGSYNNTTDPVSSTNGGTGLASNTATLVAIAPPVISKAFSPSTILPGQNSTITFTLTNPNSAQSLSGVGFTDTFPANLQVASPPNVTTSGCGALVFAPDEGDTSLALSSGGIAAGGACTISLDVTALTAGVKYNTTGVVSATEGGSGSTSNTAALYVDNPHLSLTKSIASGDLYKTVGATIRYNYLLTNDGNVTLAGAGTNGLFTITDDQINSGAAFTCPPSPTGLAPGDTLTCTADYTVTQNDLNYGSVLNTAQAHGKYGSTAVNSNPDSVIAKAAPILTKQLSSTELNDPLRNNQANQATIGELATYTLTVTIPKGTTPDARLTDSLDNGLSFVEIQSVTYSAGVTSTNSIGTGSSPSNVTISDENGGVDNQLVFHFGDITNANADYSVQETITIIYQAEVQNSSVNQSGNSLDNQAGFAWTGDSVTQQTPTTLITVVEPSLTIQKEQTAIGADAGDLVTFKVTLINENASDDTAAYNVTFSDIIPTGLTYTPGSAQISAVLGECSPGAPTSFSFDGDTHTLSAAWAVVFNPADSCIFTFSATLDNSVYPGQTIAANTAEVQWTSLPGVSPRERTGADGLLNGASLNNYRQQDSTDPFQVTDVQTLKSVVSSSEPHTTGANAAIGEIVRYRLAMQLPEGTVTNLQLLDTFAGTGAGQRFLNDGTAKVLFVGTTPGRLTSAAVGDAPALTGCTNLADPTSYSLANAADPLQIASTAVTCSLADGNISSAEASNQDAYNTNTPVYFKLGTLTNTDNDPDAEYILVEFNALVTNEANNLSGRTLTDSFIARRHNGVSMVNLGSASAPITLTVVEPNIPFSEAGAYKTASLTTGDGGDSIEYTVTYTAGAGANRADAYDVRLVDNLSTLPLSGLSFIPGSDVSYTNCSDPGALLNNSNTTRIDITLPHMAMGCTLTVKYRATLTSAVAPNQVITNTATLTYTSLPEDGSRISVPANNPTGSETLTGSSGAVTGERNGSGTAPNTYTGIDTATLTVNNVAVQKAVVTTSEAHTTGANVAIGEIVRYRLVMQLPESSVTNLQFLDTFAGTGGQRFINDLNAVKFLFVGNNTVSSTTFGSGLGEIPSVPASACANYAGTFTLSQAADPGVIPSSAVNCTLADANISSAEANNTDTFNTNTSVYFKLGSVANSDTDNARTEYVIVEYNALVTNEAINVAGDTLTNSFRSRYENGGSMANLGSASTNTSLTVTEPNIPFSEAGAHKTASITAGDGGDQIEYTVTYTSGAGVNRADAYDVRLVDDLSGLPLSGLSFIPASDLTLNANCLTPGTLDNDSNATRIDVTLPHVATGCTVTLKYRAALTSAVYPNQPVTNTATLTYTSLPDSGTLINPTNSATPGASGDPTGERSGSGTAPNLYTGTDTATIAINNVAVQKAGVSSSEPHTSGLNVAIGEIVRYRLAMQLPEGTVTDLQLLDTFAGTGAGQRFLNDGTAKVLFVGTTPGRLTSAAVGDVPALTGCANLADPTSYSLANAADPAQIASTAVTCSLADGNISSAEASNQDAYNTNTPVYFKLGTLTNTDNDPDAEYILIEFNALVTNEANNLSGRTLTDSFIARRHNGVSMVNLGSSSAPASLTIREPAITNLDVAASTVNTPPDAGDTITYTLTLTNSGATDAMEVKVVDDISSLPLTNLVFNPVSDVTTIGGTCTTPGTPIDASTGSKLEVTLPRVSATCQMQIVFKTDINNSIAPGQSISNQADLTYTSLPGDGIRLTDSANNPTGSETLAGSSGSPLGERNGNGTAPNNYFDSDSVAITMEAPALVKSITSTSEAHTPEDGAGTIGDPVLAAIGEILRYRLDVTLPEGTSNAFTLSDSLPSGLSYLGNPRISLIADAPMTLPADLAGAEGAVLPPTFTIPIERITIDGQNVTFSLGDLINHDSDLSAEKVVIEFNVLVNNEASNNNGDLKDNTFNLSVAGSPLGTSEPISVKVVEPLLTLAKSASPDTDWNYEDTITYTLALTHDPTSSAQAFNIEIVDVIPTGLTYLENSITAPAASGWVTAWDDLTNTLRWTCDSPACSLPVTPDSASFTYQVSVNPSNSADHLIGSASADNTAQLTWTSLPGSGTLANPTGSDIQGAPGKTDGERDGSGTPAVNDHATSATHSGSLADYYAVGNRIWADRNNNAVRDVGETGIDGVLVQLFHASDLTTVLAADTTSDGGYYLFDYLLPGDYVVAIPASNFTSGGALFGRWSSLASMDVGGAELTEAEPVDPDDDVDRNDDGMWADPRVISKAFTLGPTGGTEPENETETQAGVGQGALSDNHANLSVDFGFFQVIQLSGKVWHDVNADGTQSGAEPAIAGASVTLTWAGLDGSLATTLDNETYPAVTSAAIDGSWSIPNLTPGVYRTVVSGMPDGLTQPTFDLDGIVTPDLAEFTIDSEEGHDGIDFGYRGAGSLGDFVWFDLNQDGIQDAGEPGVAGVNLTLTWAGPDADLTTTTDNLVYADIASDVDGHYSFANLPGGQFQIHAALPAGAQFAAFQAGGNLAVDSDFDPLSGETEALTLANEASDPTIDLGMMLYSIDKSVSATSFAPTTGNTVTIGEIVTYDLTLTFPEGASANTRVIDNLPAGLAYVTGSASLILGEFDGTAALDSTAEAPGQVTFNLGTVVVNNGAASPDNSLTIRFDALVADVSGNIGLPGQQNSLINSASVQVDTGPVVLSNTATLQVVEPQLTLEKSFTPTTADLGETVTVHLTVENIGASPAYDVIITDPLLNEHFTAIQEGVTPAGFTFATTASAGTTTVTYTADSAASIPVGGSLTYTFQVDVAETAIPGTVLPNTATITQAATLPGPNANRRLEPTIADTANLQTVGTDLTITKTDAPDPVVAGENLTYTMVVGNQGPYPATQVRVDDFLPVGMSYVSAVGDNEHTWSCGYTPQTRLVSCALDELAVEDTTTITLTVSVSSGTVGPLVNVATVTSDLLDSKPTDNQDSTSTTVTQNADVSIEKTGAATQFAGTDLVYSLVVSNAGPSDAHNLSVSDPLPAGVSLRSVSADSGHSWTCSGTDTIACTLSALTAGDSSTLTVTVRIAVETSGTLVNTASVSTTTPDPDSGNNADTLTTDVLPAPYLTASKLAAEIDSNGLIIPGEVIEYTIHVTNTGLSDAEDVVFSDTPGDYTSLVVGSVITSVPGSTVISGNTAGNQTIAVDLGTLPAQTGSATITFRVKIASPLPVGVNSVSNQGIFNGSNFQTVTTDNHLEPDNPGDPTVTYVNGTPRVAAIKSVTLVADPDQNLAASSGDTLEYTIKITNSGDAADSTVIFTDIPDPNTTLVPGSVETSQGSVTLGNGEGDTTVAVDIGTLPGAGGEVIITLRTTINIPLPSGTRSVINQGVVDGQATHILTDDPVTENIDDPTGTNIIGPTAVTLLHFRASASSNQQVRLEWATAVEVNNYGFILKRAPVNDYNQAVEIGFIASAVPGGSGSGTAYEYLDTPPQAGEWVYWLVDVDTQGQQMPHTQTASVDSAQVPGYFIFTPFVSR